MATNKTIQPTNVTVQIPAMADKPNQATNSNCLDKIIDGVNAINDLISNNSFGQYGSRELAAKGIYNGMSNGTIKFGTVGVTGVSNYLFIAFRNDSTKGIIMMLNQGNIIRMLYTTDGSTFTEKSLTAS